MSRLSGFWFSNVRIRIIAHFAMPREIPLNLAHDDRVFRLFAVHQYMRDCVSEPVQLGEFAQKAGLSRFHFLRLFQKTFGRTPHQLVMDFRLARARELLTETDLPITEICFACGYESLGSFSHLFRREMGCSPRQFRLRRPRLWSVNIAFLRSLVPFCLLDGFRWQSAEKQFPRSNLRAGLDSL